jgi:2-C-methyl-D-erythritol 4-phosphate cytidylyltransferase
MINKYAVIVAGGSGTRMKTDIPKQFLLIKNKPIIIHTIEKFMDANKDIKLIIVLPKAQYELWEVLKIDYPFIANLITVNGGNTRSESVINGLNAISENGVVAIHDAVRPNVSATKINELLHHASLNGNAIPAIPCIDTVRMKQENGNYKVLDRDKIWLMQTPQCFIINDIKKAYLNTATTTLTDDAAAIELMGLKLNMVDGEKNNIKITTPEDLKWMEFII